MKSVFAVAIIIMLCGCAVAFWHGTAQVSGSKLISGAGEFLKSGGGDQLVVQ